MKEAFTTGDVARICRVTINTVVKWFDTGEIKGYRVPSSRARRVARKDLLKFMRKHKLPMDELASHKVRILLLDSHSATQSLFRKAFADTEVYALVCATTNFEAGLQARDFAPNIVFLNAGLAGIDAGRICETLSASKDTAGITVIAMSAKLTRKKREELKKQGCREVLLKPVKAGDLRKIVDKYAP